MPDTISRCLDRNGAPCPHEAYTLVGGRETDSVSNDEMMIRLLETKKYTHTYSFHVSKHRAWRF